MTQARLEQRGLAFARTEHRGLLQRGRRLCHHVRPPLLVNEFGRSADVMNVGPGIRKDDKADRRGGERIEHDGQERFGIVAGVDLTAERGIGVLDRTSQVATRGLDARCCEAR